MGMMLRMMKWRIKINYTEGTEALSKALHYLEQYPDASPTVYLMIKTDVVVQWLIE